MSEFLHSLVQRIAGDAEPGTIRPQQTLLRSYNVPGDELQWELQPHDPQYPATDAITAGNTNTDRSHSRSRGDRGHSSDDTPEQHRQKNISQPVTPDSQKDTNNSADTKRVQEPDSAKHPVSRESNPPRPRITPDEKMQMLNIDLDSRTESKYKIETPISHTTEIKEREYLEKVIERVTKSQVEMRSTYQNRLMETPQVANQEIQRNADESGESKPGPKMIQPQSSTPEPVDIQSQKRTEPDVVIENLTVEVVREKKAPPVKKVQIPVVDQNRVEPQKTDSRKSVGTKLRFGLGQI